MTVTHQNSQDYGAHRLIAHRGGGRLAPENTLGAFAVGLEAGFTAFECDVKLSADGVPFLLHDDWLERTTLSSGRASWRSWQDLAGIDAGSRFGAAFAGERVPSLAELGQLLSGRDVWLNLEIKPDEDASVSEQEDWGRRIAHAAAVIWANHPQQPLLSSFSVAALQGAAVAAPHLPRAWLLDALPSIWRDAAQALALQAIHLGASHYHDDVLTQLHRARLALRVYTVNDQPSIESLLRAGVDGVFTDDAGGLLARLLPSTGGLT